MKQIDGKNVYSVSEVNFFARQRLEEMTFWIEAEVAECEQVASYNFYRLTLKDSKTNLPCVAGGEVLQALQDQLIGKRVFVYGNLTLWEPRGQYQFRILRLEEAGVGIFQKKLEELVKKLMLEGLFDEKHKKQIPQYPTKVGLVTSYKSAAWTDFKSHTADEFSIIELYTADVRVQGEQSIPSLLKVLPHVDSKGFDVVVITRGGGSLEDLAAFNDEKVARAIFKMKTPTIVAIGHEHNQSLAEWVADIRASTPTQAAHITTQGYYKLQERLEGYRRYFKNKFEQLIDSNIQNLSFSQNRLEGFKDKYIYLPDRLDKLKENLKRHEKHLIENSSLRLNTYYNQLEHAATSTIGHNSQKLNSFVKQLAILSPDNTLKRGYSATYNKLGKIIKSVDTVVVGDDITVKLFDGQLFSKVKSKMKHA